MIQKKAFCLFVALTSCATLCPAYAAASSTRRAPQGQRATKPPPRKARAKSHKVPKPNFVSTFGQHLLLSTLGAIVMLGLCGQFNTDANHHIDVIMDPSTWGYLTIAWVAVGTLVALGVAFYFAYAYQQHNGLKLTYPLTTHAVGYGMLCLQGAVATFFVFYVMEPTITGGLEYNKFVAALPALLSIGFCAATAHFYVEKAAQQIALAKARAQKAREKAAQAAAEAKQTKEEKKSFLGGLLGGGSKPSDKPKA